jgi:hypothetical protein
MIPKRMRISVDKQYLSKEKAFHLSTEFYSYVNKKISSADMLSTPQNTEQKQSYSSQKGMILYLGMYLYIQIRTNK